jgi:predicted ATPase
MRVPQAPDPGYCLKKDGSNAAAVLAKIIWLGAYSENSVSKLLQRLMAEVSAGVTRVSKLPLGNRETLRFEQDIGLEQPVEFDALNMSDGTLRALGLLLAIYQQFPKVVGIEEPEATVHPAIMEMIMEVLMDASNDKQILVTTHSPEILDYKGLKDDQIRVVTWNKGRTSIAGPSSADRQAIRERLYTPGELLRIGELGPDVQEAERSGREVDLFGEPFTGEVIGQ